jgi:hypothetical protein
MSSGEEERVRRIIEETIADLQRAKMPTGSINKTIENVKGTIETT